MNLLQQIDQAVPFCKHFLQALEIFLEQSKIIPNPQTKLMIEEIEEFQQDERGMSIGNFRTCLEDTYLQTYNLLSQTYG